MIFFWDIRVLFKTFFFFDEIVAKLIKEVDSLIRHENSISGVSNIGFFIFIKINKHIFLTSYFDFFDNSIHFFIYDSARDIVFLFNNNMFLIFMRNAIMVCRRVNFFFIFNLIIFYLFFNFRIHKRRLIQTLLICNYFIC